MKGETQQFEIIWRPTQRSGAKPMESYREHVNQRFETSHRDTKELQKWTVEQPHDFWIDLYTYLDFVPPLPPSTVKAYDDTLPLSSIPPFFPSAEFNYAENILFANPNSDAPALIAVGENQGSKQVITWHELREQVRLTASALRRSGIEKGDRVAALVATTPWAVVLYHASASIGAIFTSISPDLGVEGCISRLQQVTPKILFIDSHACYNGRVSSTADKTEKILASLRPQPETFIIQVAGETGLKLPHISEFLRRSNGSDSLSFTRVPFNHPLMICYSSGTTGAPKCIVHQHGALMQFRKTASLHNCLTAEDVVLQYSSTSWVVFYGMCGNLSVGATVILYNGSPLYPDTKQLFRICEEYKVSYMGVSPRLLLEMEMSGTVPKNEFNLSRLKTVQTTGAPLSEEQYKWFYRSFPQTVQIGNIAGGTETATALIAMDPCAPLVVGEMQVLALGMDVDVLDPETGASIASTGLDGELVIRKPFPSMPCFFWGDKDGKLYKSAYFERFATLDVWAQHDLLRRNPHTGGYIMQGRSDGVLNPSGIRFGSGEIYGVVETPQFSKYFSNCLCVGRRRQSDRDEKVFLFLVMRPGHTLTSELRDRIRKSIRNALSPRHVPRFIIAVPEIPMTINGKRVEVAVKKILSGRDVRASATVVNPASLEWFKRFYHIESEPDQEIRPKM